MSISFTASRAVTVTIPASEFATDARRHAARAETYADQAAASLATARDAAATLPADFRTPGGASAADVLRMMETDADAVAAHASLAADAAILAGNAPTAQQAAWAEHDALIHFRAARFDTGTVVRYAAYLTGGRA